MNNVMVTWKPTDDVRFSVPVTDYRSLAVPTGDANAPSVSVLTAAKQLATN